MKHTLLTLALLILAGCAYLPTDVTDRIAAELARLERYDKDSEAQPTPDDPKPGKPTANPMDEIDLSTVVWHGPDVRAWPTSSTMPSGAYVHGSTLHFPHSQSGQWQQNASGLEGNIWVVVKLPDGKWHAATFEWLKKGQTSKPWAKVRADHIKVSAFGNYQLQRGEEFYAFPAGLSRGNDRGTKGRAAARKVAWK